MIFFKIAHDDDDLTQLIVFSGSGGKYDATHERRMQEIKTELKQRGVR